ncbi:MAG: ribonuclease H-like domain-containing protein [Candidatus Woesearchaeota archaeon]
MKTIIDIETAPLKYGKHLSIEYGKSKDIGALSPITGRITAAGWMTQNDHRICLHENEKIVLQEFWNSLPSTDIVGFNTSFDIHFLLVRSLHHNISITPLTHVIDLREVMWGQRKKGTLNDYAKLIGVDTKLFEGRDAPLLWKEKLYDTLKDYLHQDLKITYALYEQCVKIGLL